MGEVEQGEKTTGQKTQCIQFRPKGFLALFYFTPFFSFSEVAATVYLVEHDVASSCSTFNDPSAPGWGDCERRCLDSAFAAWFFYRRGAILCATWPTLRSRE